MADQTESTNELVPQAPDPGTAVLPLFRAERLPATRTPLVVEREPLSLDPHPELVMLTRPGGVQAARFRALRHRVVERGDPRTLLVTSPCPHEGKTYVAANLALAFAELRRHRVLLVEGNPRKPALAARLGLEPGQHVCLLSQLEEHRADPGAPWRVTALGAGELHLLAVGGVPRARPLDPPMFAQAMTRLRSEYDYVVVDGPAVLPGPDVNLLEDSVESILLVGRAGKTRGKQLRAALEQISPANVLGLALVDV